MSEPRRAGRVRHVSDAAWSDPQSVVVVAEAKLPHQPHDSPRKYYELYEGRPDVPEHCIPYYASISYGDSLMLMFLELALILREKEDAVFLQCSIR